ncbi:hypothetical protein QBC45DRAFT_96601 [Copromyces sp. CBS 386.78]|nr:hypothetical protein QBC45DRAFT_96601 [Copromyces sp. CBS 386.78]
MAPTSTEPPVTLKPFAILLDMNFSQSGHKTTQREIQAGANLCHVFNAIGPYSRRPGVRIPTNRADEAIHLWSTCQPVTFDSSTNNRFGPCRGPVVPTYGTRDHRHLMADLFTSALYPRSVVGPSTQKVSETSSDIDVNYRPWEPRCGAIRPLTSRRASSCLTCRFGDNTLDMVSLHGKHHPSRIETRMLEETLDCTIETLMLDLYETSRQSIHLTSFHRISVALLASSSTEST